MSVAKTYVLLDHTKPSANVSIQINATQRVKIGSRKFERPALQIGFTDKAGQSRILRFKLSTSKIFQDEQIKDGILANEKFTQREYDALAFRHGVLMTRNETVQKFLENHPQNEVFWEREGEDDARYCDEIRQPLFKLFDKSVEIKATNKETRKRIEAGAYIYSLALDGANDLLIRLQGSHVQRRTDLEELQNELIEWLDQTDEAGIETLLRKDTTADEKAVLCITKAIDAKILSFDQEPGFAVKLKGVNVIKLKELPSDMGLHDQQLYFAEFLLSDAGKLIYQDLKKEVEKVKEKAAA